MKLVLPKELIGRLLSDSSGWAGIGLAYLAGVLTLTGGVIGMSLVTTLYKAGVSGSVLDKSKL